MSSDITGISGISPQSFSAARGQEQKLSPGAAPVAAVVSPPDRDQSDVQRPVEPAQVLDTAVRTAAESVFKGREIEVSNFRDESSGRFVYRIADKKSGELLVQSPPDELLRFYASSRELNEDGALISIEA